jgi:nucleobase:cation symporter-1, NCS1 family
LIVYNLNYFCGFLVALVVYYVLCWVSPIPATSDHWLEIDDDATGRSASLAYDGEGSDVENAYAQPAEDVKTGMPKSL